LEKAVDDSTKIIEPPQSLPRNQREKGECFFVMSFKTKKFIVFYHSFVRKFQSKKFSFIDFLSLFLLENFKGKKLLY
jgi:hypothetical protein